MTATTHIIGAGLAGLSAAVRLAQAGAQLVVHEATKQAGGRCRSYWDSSTNLTIDNGTHLLLSGNYAARDYLRTIGTEDQMVASDAADFPFADLATGERWTVRINEGRIPWWILDQRRRVPGTSLGEYVALGRLLTARPGRTVGETVPCRGPLYDRLVYPLLLAALNTDPAEGDAALAGAIVRETLLMGGSACHPMIARDGLTPAFVDPALSYIEARGAIVRFEHELRSIKYDETRATALDFGAEIVTLDPEDSVVVAVPAFASSNLVPGLPHPSVFRPIINVHYRVVPPRDFPRMLGVVNATAEWVFAFPDRITVTISAADRFMKESREALAGLVWGEIAKLSGLPADLPPWQLVRERRATFAATPAENAKRPPTTTRWNNLVVAGDWTGTGLPATIEGTIRSGHRAAQCLMQMRPAS